MGAKRDGMNDKKKDCEERSRKSQINVRRRKSINGAEKECEDKIKFNEIKK